MSVLVTYKGVALRQLESGTLTLLTAGKYMEGNVDIRNYGPESAAVSCSGRQTIAIGAGAGRTLLTAGKTAPGDIELALLSGSASLLDVGLLDEFILA